jgi:hypothetical protein
MKSGPRFHDLANHGNGVVEEGVVFPIAVGKETACEARISWSITFTTTGGPPAVTNSELVLKFFSGYLGSFFHPWYSLPGR